MKHKLSKQMRDMIEKVTGWDKNEYYIEPETDAKDSWWEFWLCIAVVFAVFAPLCVPLEWMVWITQ